MRKLVLPVIFGTSVLASAIAAYAADTPFDTKSSGVLNVAVFGDAPYGTTPTDTSEFLATPAFIDSINADPEVSLVLHVGDIHSGKQFCTEAYDQSIYDLWTAFKYPLVYTPGDNEWTDCHKAGEGGGTYNATTGQIKYVLDANGNPVDYAKGDPVANLDLVRSIFFANPGYALADRKLVLSQSQAEYSGKADSDSNYVENVMWEQSKVLFVTINLPGGSNNDNDNWYGAPRTTAQTNEITERTGADLRWLDLAFARAKADGAKAVVIQLQADMWDLDGKPASHIAEYKPFIDSIASHTTAFGKPVLLLNGDSHVYRSDNPLVQGAPCVIEPSPGAQAVACSNDAYANQPNGYNVPKFHRIVVHGSTFPLEWLKLTINPRANAANGVNAFGPFSWERKTQQ